MNMIKITASLLTAFLLFYFHNASSNPFRSGIDRQGYTYEEGGPEYYCDDGVYWNVRRPKRQFDLMLAEDEPLEEGGTWIDHFHP